MQHSGLEGVIAGKTAISNVGKHSDDLRYRGYSIYDLAENAIFEEVCYLLLYGVLPDKNTLNSYQVKLTELRNLPDLVKNLLQLLPKSSHPMDVLRTVVSFMGSIEPEIHPKTQQVEVVNRLIAMLPSALCYWYQLHFNNKSLQLESRATTLSEFFLELLYDAKPDPIQVAMLNVSLILYAEHEFNASTFAARVTTATGSDIYSAITSAIGTLRGPLHGGANEKAMELIEQFDSPDEAEIAIKKMLGQKIKIMGFGHRVYKLKDPRSDVIKQWSKKMAYHVNNINLYNISERIEHIMWQEKHLFPNLDFYSASSYHFAKIPTSFFTPIFVFSRLAGWGAHIFEQRANNRLIRPDAEYIGPEPKKYIVIDKRGN
jgi:2-methylcitrate synthase